MLLLLCCASCGKNEKKLPVPESSLPALLADLHVAEAMIQNTNAADRDSIADIYYQQVFLLHEIEEAAFSVRYFKRRSGVKDWEIAKVAQLEGWCVITADRDRRRKPRRKRLADGPPLHKILPPKKVSAVYLSGAIQCSDTIEKIRAIISVLHKIKEFFKEAEPGSSALLHKDGDRFALRVR